MNQNNLVEVMWQDAACEHANLTQEEAEAINPMPRQNVGYLILDDEDDKVVLASGIIFDSDKNLSCLSDTLVIPKGDVLCINYLIKSQQSE